jgi:hypothetical protein
MSHNAGLGLPGIAFTAPDRVFSGDHIDGVLDSASFVAGYQSALFSGDGTNPRTVTCRFVAIALPARVPHIILRRRGLGFLGAAGITRVGAMYELEGDFPRSFSVTCADGGERDALRILTPDLMAVLVDNASRYDIEFVDTWALFYRGPLVRRTTDVAGARRLVAAVHPKLSSQARRFEPGAAPAATISPEQHEAARTRRTALSVRATRGRTLAAIAFSVIAGAIIVYGIVQLF